MTEPSNPDLVEQFAEKYVTVEESGAESFMVYFGQHLFDERHSESEALEFAQFWRKEFARFAPEAIREAISVTRRETLEQAAKLADKEADDRRGMLVNGRQTWTPYEELAAEIRRLGENK